MFSKSSSGKFGVRPYCKVCQALYDKVRYTKRGDYIKSKSAKWKKENTTKRKEYRIKWKKANKGKVSEYNKQYRNLIKLAGDLNVLNALKTVIRRKDMVCKGCNIYGKCTVDHIIPISKGGNNSKDNLQILCALCNSIKSNKIPNA